MWRTVVIMFLSVLVAGTAAATGHTANLPVDDFDTAVERYNANTDQLPGIARSLIRDERIELNVSTENGNIVYGFVLDGVEVMEYQEGGINDPTLTVYTSMATLEEIAQDDNPRQRGVEAFRSGDIWYETRGVWRSIKFGIMFTLIKMFG